ncbi:MAG: Ig-like domain-containing protein, partial [bacterium]
MNIRFLHTCPVFARCPGRHRRGRVSSITLAIAFAVVVLSGSALAGAGSGTAVVLPSDDVVAGSQGTWSFLYIADEPFSGGTMELVIADDWTPPQQGDAAAAGYVSVVPDTLGISIAAMVITVSVDTMSIGDTVTVVYGDTSGASTGRATAQTLAQESVVFEVRSDPLGAAALPIAASPALRVVAAQIDDIVFITPLRMFTAGGESDVMVVRTEDAFGNPKAVDSNQEIGLQSSSTDGQFSHLGGGDFSETDSVTILAGEDTVSFYYRDTKAGIHTITADAAGQPWSDAQQIIVEAAEPFRLVASPGDTLVDAGEYVLYGISIEDAYGNPSPVQSDVEVSLVSFGAGSFYRVADTTQTDTVMIRSGEQYREVYYRGTVKDLSGYQLFFMDTDGSPPALETSIALITIDHNVLSVFVSDLAVDTDTVVANGVDEVEVTVTAADTFGNGIDSSTVVLSATDTGGGNVYDQPGLTGVDGVAVGRVRSTVAEDKWVRASAGG